MVWNRQSQRHSDARKKAWNKYYRDQDQKNNRNKYLGKTVKDAPPEGLSSEREVAEISDAIVKDYEKGRISKKTANGRLAILQHPIIDRTKALEGKRRSSHKIVQIRRDKLKGL